jgi:hypothetical protein
VDKVQKLNSNGDIQAHRKERDHLSLV